MVAVVTLRVTACAGGAAISGAQVTDGYNSVYTNSYGEILVYWDDTAYVGYGVNIIKSGYQSRNIALYNSQNGTTVTTCLNVAPPPSNGGGGGGGGISCFIVTAATGSPESAEVTALRALRDDVGAKSAIAAALIEAVYDEYWQFSPAIADRIAGDDATRQGTLLAVVRPLLGWYRLAGALALGRGDADDERAGLEQACPGWMSPATIAGLVAALRRDGTVPKDAPDFVRSIAAQLAHGASLPLVDWAILRPLQTCWDLAAGDADIRAAVADWLGDAPVERVTSTPSANAVAAVASLLDFDPLARRRLIARFDTAREAKTDACPCDGA